MFEIGVEPASPDEGACLRYMLNRSHRHMRSVLEICYDEPEAP